MTKRDMILDSIHALEATAEEIKGEAGRYWQDCPFTQETLASIRRDVKELDRQLRWLDPA